MLRALDVLLNEDPFIAEGGFCSGLAEFERTFEFIGLMDDLHPDATATCGRLDDDRIADVVSEGAGDLGTGNGFRRFLWPWAGRQPPWPPELRSYRPAG